VDCREEHSWAHHATPCPCRNPATSRQPDTHKVPGETQSRARLLLRVGGEALLSHRTSPVASSGSLRLRVVVGRPPIACFIWEGDAGRRTVQMATWLLDMWLSEWLKSAHAPLVRFKSAPCRPASAASQLEARRTPIVAEGAGARRWHVRHTLRWRGRRTLNRHWSQLNSQKLPRGSLHGAAQHRSRLASA
jgi:hypothetical protein